MEQPDRRRRRQGHRQPHQPHLAEFEIQQHRRRFAQRSYERALEDRAERRVGLKRSLRIEQVTVRLSARDLARLNERLDSLTDFLAKADESGEQQIYLVTLSTAPL